MLKSYSKRETPGYELLKIPSEIRPMGCVPESKNIDIHVVIFHNT
jgi:hypothetical protein